MRKHLERYDPLNAPPKDTGSAVAEDDDLDEVTDPADAETADPDDDDEGPSEELDEQGNRTLRIKTGISASKAPPEGDYAGQARKLVIDTKIPGDVAGFERDYGHDVTYGLLVSQMTALRRAKARKPLEEGWSDEKITELLTNHRPDAPRKRTKKSPQEQVREGLGQMSREEKIELFREIYGEDAPLPASLA